MGKAEIHFRLVKIRTELENLATEAAKNDTSIHPFSERPKDCLYCNVSNVVDAAKRAEKRILGGA